MRACLLLLALTAAACGPAPLAAAHTSPDALAQAVLTALERRDQSALHGLALSEEEFRTHVWPSLPAARPERNLPVEYVWNDLRQKSVAELASTLTRQGGRHHQIVSVDLEGHARDYGGFRVHSGVSLKVREPGGGSSELRVFGSLIEQEGRWKVFSYIVDERS